MEDIEALQNEYDKRSNYYRKHLKLKSLSYGRTSKTTEKLYNMEIQKTKSRYYRTIHLVTENTDNFEIKTKIEFYHMHFTNWTLFGPKGCTVDEKPYVVYNFTVKKTTLNEATKETRKLTKKHIQQTK